MDKREKPSNRKKRKVKKPKGETTLAWRSHNPARTVALSAYGRRTWRMGIRSKKRMSN
jgi:hypothetical protein